MKNSFTSLCLLRRRICISRMAQRSVKCAALIAASPQGVKCRPHFRSNRTSPRYDRFCIPIPTSDIMIPEQPLVLEGGILVDLGAVRSRIKAAREKRHLTQDELAAIVDLSPAHISVIERGVKPPKLETFVKIANVLGCPPIHYCRMWSSTPRKALQANSQPRL